MLIFFSLLSSAHFVSTFTEEPPPELPGAPGEIMVDSKGKRASLRELVRDEVQRHPPRYWAAKVSKRYSCHRRTENVEMKEKGKERGREEKGNGPPGEKGKRKGKGKAVEIK